MKRKQKRVVILVGLETIKNPDGSVKFHADTFWDNACTWKHEHLNNKNNPEYDLKILDARNYKDLKDPIASIWDELMKDKIDLLFYFGHSDDTILYLISRYRLELENHQRFIDFYTDWTSLVFNEGAEIYLCGCHAGGREGKKFDVCIAQDVANKTKVNVFAYVSKSYQKEGPKNHFHQVSDDKIGFVKFEPKS